MSEREYKVGKGRPPVEHRFKKGEPSRNPSGRRKAEPMDVLGFFAEPLIVEIMGKRQKLCSYELGLINMANKAISGDMRAAGRVVGLFDEAGLLKKPPVDEDGPCAYRVSSAWDHEEWDAMYQKYGPPPWPGPKNGLANDDWREEVLRG